VLRKLPADFDISLPEATRITNHRKMNFCDYSPIKLLTGIPLTTLPMLQEIMGPSQVEEMMCHFASDQNWNADVARFTEVRDEIRDEANEANARQKLKMKRAYDKGVRARNLSLKDLIFLYQTRTGILKLRLRGPFRIAKVGEYGVSYKLRQMSGALIKRTYHGNNLERLIPRPGRLCTGYKEDFKPYQQLREPRSRLRRTRKAKAALRTQNTPSVYKGQNEQIGISSSQQVPIRAFSPSNTAQRLHIPAFRNY